MESRSNSVLSEMLAVSATTTVGVEKQHNRLLLLQNRRQKMTEENYRKESLPEAVGKTLQKFLQRKLYEPVV